MADFQSNRDVDNAKIEEDKSFYSDDSPAMPAAKRKKSEVEESNKKEETETSKVESRNVKRKSVNCPIYSAKKHLRLVNLINSHAQNLKILQQREQASLEQKGGIVERSLNFNAYLHSQLMQETKSYLNNRSHFNVGKKAIGREPKEPIKSDEQREIDTECDKAQQLNLEENVCKKLDTSLKQTPEPLKKETLIDSETAAEHESSHLAEDPKDNISAPPEETKREGFISKQVDILISLCDQIFKLERHMNAVFINSVKSETGRKIISDVIDLDNDFWPELQILVDSSQNYSAAESFRKCIHEIKNKLQVVGENESSTVPDKTVTPSGPADIADVIRILPTLWETTLVNNRLLAQLCFSMLDWILLDEPQKIVLKKQLLSCNEDIEEIGRTIENARRSITDVLNKWTGSMEYRELLELSYLLVVAGHLANLYLDLVTQMWVVKIEYKSLFET